MGPGVAYSVASLPIAATPRSVVAPEVPIRAVVHHSRACDKYYVSIVSTFPSEQLTATQPLFPLGVDECGDKRRQRRLPQSALMLYDSAAIAVQCKP